MYSKDRQRVKERVERAWPSAKAWMIPSLEQMLEAPEISYLYQNRRRECENDVALALHSSGSTGMFEYSLCPIVKCK